MTDSLKAEYGKVADMQYGGNPAGFLPQGQLTRVAGNAALASAVMGALTIGDPSIESAGPSSQPKPGQI